MEEGWVWCGCLLAVVGQAGKARQLDAAPRWDAPKSSEPWTHLSSRLGLAGVGQLRGSTLLPQLRGTKHEQTPLLCLWVQQSRRRRRSQSGLVSWMIHDVGDYEVSFCGIQHVKKKVARPNGRWTRCSEIRLSNPPQMPLPIRTHSRTSTCTTLSLLKSAFIHTLSNPAPSPSSSPAPPTQHPPTQLPAHPLPRSQQPTTPTRSPHPPHSNPPSPPPSI